MEPGSKPTQPSWASALFFCRWERYRKPWICIAVGLGPHLHTWLTLFGMSGWTVSQTSTSNRPLSKSVVSSRVRLSTTIALQYYDYYQAILLIRNNSFDSVSAAISVQYSRVRALVRATFLTSNRTSQQPLPQSYPQSVDTFN